MNPEIQALYDQRTALRTSINQIKQLGSFATEAQKWQLRQFELQLKRLNQQIIISEQSVQDDFLDDVPF